MYNHPVETVAILNPNHKYRPRSLSIALQWSAIHPSAVKNLIIFTA